MISVADKAGTVNGLLDPRGDAAALAGIRHKDASPAKCADRKKRVRKIGAVVVDVVTDSTPNASVGWL